MSWKIIFSDITAKFETQHVQIFGFDFLGVLESNMFCKLFIFYIKYKELNFYIFITFYNNVWNFIFIASFTFQ